MSRFYNFSAGPAMLPQAVMEQIQAELLDWHQVGASVMELSHRSKEFKSVAEHTEQLIREILAVPKHYKVLFVHGGGQGQFTSVPMHFLRPNHYAVYLQTGAWSEIAATEAQRYGQVRVALDAKNNGYTAVAPQNSWQDFSDAEYLYYVDNETIHGLEFNNVPETGNIPLVCDMSSNIMSRPIDIEKFGIIFACAQKNLGPAGMSVVIIHEDLVERETAHIVPSFLNYKKLADKGSMVNTPTTFSWYVIGLVCEWIKKHGGVEKMEKNAKARSQLLYDFIDHSEFYINEVHPENRSRMNIPFSLADESLNQKFLEESKAAGLISLKGHRLLGGMRASMYNSMPLEGAKALRDFMQEFVKKYG